MVVDPRGIVFCEVCDMGILQHRKDTEGRIPAYIDKPRQKKGRVGRGEVN